MMSLWIYHAWQQQKKKRLEESGMELARMVIHRKGDTSLATHTHKLWQMD